MRPAGGEERGTRGILSVPAGLAIERLSGSIGARVSGVDLAHLDEPGAIAALRTALLDHLVIFLEAQTLSPQRLVEVASWFGDPMAYPQLPGLPEAPLVTVVLKREDEREAFGGVWHSDTTYLEHPPLGTLLYAVEVPPHGGDTLFANQYLAYETLSPALRRTLRGLGAVSSSVKAEVSRTREDRLREHGTQARQLEAEHPVVRRHPQTGRAALYVNRAHTVRFAGWSEDESRGLLDFLHAHQVRPEFTCRWRWSPGALAIWDNRCVQHLPINDYHGHRRRMHRVTLRGDVPVAADHGVLQDASLQPTS